MSAIDTRVVEAKFKNDQFASGVSGTLSDLDRLKAGLKLDGATHGLEQVSAAAKGFDSSNMEQGASRIGSAFSSMEAMAFGALASIGAKFASTALELAKGLTIGPIKGGLDDYHAKLNSVQTIMNATGADMQTVNGYFKQLDTYSDKTIYNLSDMTGAFAKFTNAGVGMDKSVPAIKGIANMVAVAGQGADAAGIAMYNLSQSIAGGFLTTTDYKSLNLANVATKEWKDQMIQGAIAAGTLKKTGADAYHIVGTKAGASATSAALFNEELKEGWASSDVLLGVLGKYGDTTTDIGKKAQAAAQDVKSFPMMMDTLKASVGTGWTDTFEILLGNVDESKQLFTGLTNTIGGFLGKSAEARNALLGDWKEIGGRTVLIDGLKAAFHALMGVLGPISKAFRSVFPRTTSDELFSMTESFRNFMQELIPAPATMDRIQRTFAGVFAILHIGWTILKAVAGFFMDLFAGIEEGDKGILKTTASIGDFFVGLDKALSKGKGLTTFFDNLRDLLFKVINPIKDFGQMLGNAFGGVDLGPAGKQIGDVLDKILSFGSSGEGEKSVTLVDRLTNALSFLGDMSSKIAEWAGNVGKSIAGAFDGINYDDVMMGLQTGVLTALTGGLFSLGGALRGFSIFGGKGNGLISGLSDSLGQLSGTLKSMQNENNASALLKLAGAIGILALAVVLLASVDPKALAAASVAMAIMFVELTKGMAMFNSAVGLTGAAKMVLLVPALLGIAAAILLLTIAVKVLTNLGWEGLARGLFGLGAMLAMLSASVRVMAANNKRMLSTGAGLLLLAIAINVLVFAVKQIAEMDWADLGKGLAGVAAILVGLALFTKFAKAGANAVAQGFAIAMLAGAIYVLAKAIQEMAKLSWAKMLQGLAGMDLALASIVTLMKGIGRDPKIIFAALAVAHVAGALGLIADVFMKMASLDWGEVVRGMMAFAVSFGMIILAIKAVEKVNFAQLAGLSLVTEALMQMAEALSLMGEMSTDEIVHGLAGLVGAIGVLTVALIALSKVPANAGVSLGIVAASLALLAPALATMAAIPMAGIAGALVLLAGTFLVVGVASKLLASSVPVLLGLGIAIGLLGLAIALAGAGVLAFALGLTMLGAAGAVATAGIVAIVSGLIGLIPMLIEQFGLGIVALIRVIGDAAPEFVKAFTAILISLLDSVIAVIPKLAELFVKLIMTALAVITTLAPKIFQAGISLILGFLSAIAKNIGKMVDVVTKIITEFLNALGRNLPKIIQSGYDLIISFMNGIGDAARKNGKPLADAGWNMASGIVEGFFKGLSSLAGKVKDAAIQMAKDAWNGALDFLGIHSPSRRFIEVGKYTSEGFAIGLVGNKEKIQAAGKTMAEQLAGGMAAVTATVSAQAKKVNDLIGKRAENMRQIARAQEDLARAQAREVGSTARSASARAAEIKREQAAKDAAIRAANERLRKLGLAQKQYDKDIKAAQIARNAAASEQKRIAAAQAQLKSMANQQTTLEKLADQHDVLTEKIKDASKALEDATKTRDDYNKSLTDSYGTQEAVNKDTHLADYVKNLQQQIVDTQNFTIAIQELRRLGLNDELYKQLLSSGTEAMPFVQELLAGGKGAVDEINSLGSSLDKEASRLGSAASASLYQAGVDAAAGLVKGLENEQANIDAQMQKIADSMVNAIKAKLGIKSPSRVLAQLGVYSAQGFAKGLDDSNGMVSRSAENLSQNAVDMMKRTFTGLGDLIAGDMDTNPVITPVLDLSDVRKSASVLESLLSTQPLTVDSSYAGVRVASAGYTANEDARAEAELIESPAPITFIQNNSSPKALSSAEIYRNTNNQISVAKGALTSNAH